MQTTSESLCQCGPIAAQTVLFPEYEDTDQQPQTAGLSKTERGSIAERLFDLWCLGNSISIYQAIGNQTKEDRLIKVNGKYIAVQIKSGSVGNAGRGKTCFSLWAGNPWTGKKKQPTNADADLMVCIGMDYSLPCLSTSFAVFMPYSSDLPQSIQFAGPVGIWPGVPQLQAAIDGAC